MTPIYRALRGLIAAALVLGLAASAAGAGKPTPPPVQISPRALQILNGACELLSSARAFSYHAEIDFDSVLPSDVKLQFAAAMDFALQRPDHLAISYASDLGAKRVWYDGKTLTILDPAQMTYATVPVPASIDGMLEQVAREKNISVPLEDLDFSQPCDRIRPKLIQGGYIGIGDVNGVECDHLAFRQKDSQWQIWIERGKRPLPRKLVITYIALPMAPQYSAILSQWNLDPRFPARFFNPRIPNKALRIKFLGMKEKGT
jgi:hypothetical protein